MRRKREVLESVMKELLQRTESKRGKVFERTETLTLCLQQLNFLIREEELTKQRKKQLQEVRRRSCYMKENKTRTEEVV